MGLRARPCARSTLVQMDHRAAKKASNNKTAVMASGPNGPPSDVGGEQAAKIVARAERIKDHQASVNERAAIVTLDACKLGKMMAGKGGPPCS